MLNTQKEIEHFVRSEYAPEHRAYESEMDIAEDKEKFLSRMLDAWDSQHFILSTLSKNLQAEVMAGNTHLSRSME